MEQIITDSLGNDITVVYDETTDTVTVKNPAVDNDFHEITRFEQSKPDMVVVIEGLDGEGSWETWSDIDARNSVVEFWLENKKNQE
jgi:hypothetical protein